MERHDCFVTPVWKFPHDSRIDLAELELAVDRQYQADQHGTLISNVGGWQSNMHLNRTPEFAGLRDFVLEKAVLCCQDWGLDFLGHSPHLNTMWANVNMQGNRNLMHHHWSFPFQNFNFLSGAYYVRCDEHSGAIRFLDERPSAKFIDLNAFMHAPNRFVGDRYRIQPTPGSVVFFPSWLDHEVTPSSGDDRRISIAFNISLPRELTDRIYNQDQPT